MSEQPLAQHLKSFSKDLGLFLSGGFERLKKSTIFFWTANLIGMALCWLFVAGICGQARMEQRDCYDFGDSITFILTAVPVFLVCLLLNVVWSIMALVALFRRRDYRPALACSIIAVLWVLEYLSMRFLP